MNKQACASILAVGTEITTGQIVNGNASWISKKLEGLGIKTLLHETIPDDRSLILRGLEQCASLSDLIFVTGGLGPTSDDFTREVIAQWLGETLQYSELAWQAIVDRLTKLGVPIAESNKQQCFFPSSASILCNPEGTAAGFTCSIKKFPGKTLWVLPGPPRELAAIWDRNVQSNDRFLIKNIHSQIQDLYPQINPLQLFTWQCLGKSEAELGEITEKVLKGSHLLTGYRYYRPFIEVKVWCPKNQISEKKQWLDQLDHALLPWIHTRGGEDRGETLLKQLSSFSTIEIHDLATGGHVAHRLSTLLRAPLWENLREKISFHTYSENFKRPKSILSQSVHESNLVLKISGLSEEFQGTISLQAGPHHFTENFKSPYQRKETLDRTQAYTAEYAFKIWGRFLEKLTLLL